MIKDNLQYTEIVPSELDECPNCSGSTVVEIICDNDWMLDYPLNRLCNNAECGAAFFSATGDFILPPYNQLVL